MAPQLIFGTATFGMDMTEFQDSSTVRPLLGSLNDIGVHRLDSGARYPPMKPGKAEELIGEARELSKDLTIDTKVYTDTKTDGSGDLTVEAIEKSLLASLQRLKISDGMVNVLHAHRADPSTPLEEQIKGFNQQIEKGRCHADQGLLNMVRPLAVGFLTGKLVNNEHAGTRADDNNPLGKVLQKLFSAEDLHDAMKKFNAEAKSHNLTSIEIAVRWIAHHSALRDEDGIILGASKSEQIKETVAMIKKGPLDEKALKAADDLWTALEGSRGGII
ncbi:MAG: hypothetical protein Q9191_004538 [Dirinaria sp. TL-2023a]